MKNISELEKGDGIRAQVIADALADGEEGGMVYLRTIAENGCGGGSCANLVYYTETHAFYAAHADEIDKMLEEYKDATGGNALGMLETHGDLRNALAWWAYETRAQEILQELGDEA